MIDFTNIALGRRPHDPTRIAAMPTGRIMAAEAPPPVELPRPGILAKPSLVQNDFLPTCTIAGLLNHLRTWAQNAHGFDLPENDELLLGLYAAISGCDATPAAIAATDGLVMADVLEYVQARGFRIDDQNVVELLFEPIDVSVAENLREAIYRDSAVYLGITLYQADVQQGLTSWSGGAAGAGPAVGGHCIVGKGYTASGFESATWGEVMPTDQSFLMERVDEGYAIQWKMATAP